MDYENQVRAVARYVRMSPQKVRLVCDLVKGKPVDEALAILKLTSKAAAQPIAKAIASAAANGDENYGMAREDLYVARIWAHPGPMLKRARFGARGRFKPILKRSAHITVVLAERQ
jgi:large subunit ribosomal protein L22